jgi:hypothetical protein
MTTRHSERIRHNEKHYFNIIINALKEMFEYFKDYRNVPVIKRSKLIRNIYILILKNIRLFHKFFDQHTLKRVFKTLTNKGYELIHSETNNRTAKKIIEKPILDMVTYIHKYNETISRVSYKLSKQMNKDVGTSIMSYIR